jgi:hypothetical protein
MAVPGRGRFWPRENPRDVVPFISLEIVLTIAFRTRTRFVTALSTRLRDGSLGPLPAWSRLLASILPGLDCLIAGEHPLYARAIVILLFAVEASAASASLPSSLFSSQSGASAHSSQSLAPRT